MNVLLTVIFSFPGLERILHIKRGREWEVEAEGQGKGEEG